MAKKGSAYGRARRAARRAYRKMTRRSDRGAEKSILGTTLAGVAASVPFLGQLDNGDSFINRVGIMASGDVVGGLTNLPAVMLNAVAQNAGEVAAAVGGALAIGWARKKFKLDRTTRVSRKWSVV